ncbi:hypothetical protein [Nocardia sp. CC227C]|uniref:hypothetical protein n=1 Tax=Nocardia sp. CC227C TaxID=3044562 RepID=UPI00278C868B|nr:hypothetical protein [Nocardia sp. CC227C]
MQHRPTPTPGDELRQRLPLLLGEHRGAGIVDAVWDWSIRDPDAFRLLSGQSHGGATPGSRTLATEYAARHERRAHDYFGADPEPATPRAAAAVHALRALRIRTMIMTTIAVHPLRLDEGPWRGYPTRNCGPR